MPGDAAVVDAVWAALERGDVDGALAGMAPDVRWHGAGMADAPSACHDREHVRRFLEAARADGRRARLLDLHAADDCLVAVVRTASADHQALHGELITVRDGAVAAIVVHPTVADALRAAGLDVARSRPLGAGLRAPAAALGRQLGDPRGRAGRLVVAALNVANRRLNRAAVEALGLRPGERMLDVGLGGGVGTRLALDRQAAVVAIDPSADAVAAARRRFGGGADVRRGSASAPGVDGMDAALAVNSIYFWPSVEHGLAGVRGALRDGGRLALGVERGPLRRHAREHVDLPADPAALARRLAEHGFTAVSIRRVGRTGAVVVGVKAATVGGP